MIPDYMKRQATPAVWAEVDELRAQVNRLEAALMEILLDQECPSMPCQHWCHWHKVAHTALGWPAEAARDRDFKAAVAQFWQTDKGSSK